MESAIVPTEICTQIVTYSGENICMATVVQTPVHSPSDRLLDMWLHGKSRHTQQAYRRYARAFLEFANAPLPELGLAHLQAWSDQLPGSESSRKTAVSAIKSLFTFAHEVGLIQVNPGRAMKLPKPKDCLSERILSEGEIHAMFALETDIRNKLILKTLYYCGLRVSELVSLQWKNAIARQAGGQLTIFGKGRKTRVVLVPVALWRELEVYRGDADSDAPIFRSREQNADGNYHMSRVQAWRVVKAAAARIGIKDPSPHWLRHAHASHSLDRGAPIHLVQQTLGHESVATTSRYLHARPGDSSSLYLGS
ncbi:tyrosine-type recombinase/integrase [Nostoc sp. CCY0012]|uniref:tyrosine-type recombinase/integrase n=1 Tax=Nostoc sp. CCY0012 TaxID=1056123 RepID=UPI0039C6FBA2